MRREGPRGSRLAELPGDGTGTVFLAAPGAKNGESASFKPLRGHRCCQAPMKARHGSSRLLEPAAGLSFPAAAAATAGVRPGGRIISGFVGAPTPTTDRANR